MISLNDIIQENETRGELRLRLSTRALLRALIVSSLVLLVHGATDFALQVPSIAAFWAFLLGCQYSFGRR